MTKRKADIEDVLTVLGDFQGMVSDRFDRVEQQLHQHDQQFAGVNKNFAEANKKLDHTYSVLDSHMKRIEDILQENAMRDRQQERMQQWIFQLADKANIKLKYD